MRQAKIPPVMHTTARATRPAPRATLTAVQTTLQTPPRIRRAQRELVVLLFLLPKEFLLFHETASLSHPASARGPLTVYSIPISGKHKFSRNIIPYPASKRKREISRCPAYFKKFPHFFQKIQSLFKSIPGKSQAPPL